MCWLGVLPFSLLLGDLATRQCFFRRWCLPTLAEAGLSEPQRFPAISKS